MFEVQRVIERVLIIGSLVAIPSSVFSEQTIRVPQDYASIQQAIDTAKTGDIVLVSPGVYQETIRLKAGISLRSAGDDSPGKIGLKRAETTIIDGAMGTKSSGVMLSKDSTLDGFTIRNVGLYEEKKWLHHHKTQGNEQPHEHIGRPSIAPVMVSSEGCRVINNIVHHNGFSGIVVSGIKKVNKKPLVKGNHCYRNMGAGISVMNTENAEITGNRCFENFYAGIGHNNASPHVHHNACFQNIRAGIGISNGSCPVVESNQCYKNRRAGIGTRTGRKTRPVIRGNKCYENDMAGIGTEEDAAPVIVNNECFKNKLAGIGCRLHASPTVVGNHCFENGKAGIGSEADTSPLIVDNDCSRNQAAGIGFAPGKEGKALVLNNRLVDNKLVAVGINRGWDVYLAGNKASRKGGMPPLVMVHQGAKAHFVDNEFFGGGVACIRIAGEVKIELCTLKGVQARAGGPPNFGIWALPGSTVDCHETSIKNWRNAANASDSKIIIKNCRALGYLQHGFVINDPKPGSKVSGNLGWSHLAVSKLIQSNALNEITDKIPGDGKPLPKISVQKRK